MIIDGKKTAAELRQELKKKITILKSTFNTVPGLTVILIGEDPASKIYVKNKEKFAKEIGINSEVIRYPENVEEKVVLDKINELNKDKKISGILVQLPLPKQIDKRKVIETILPGKDVDGFHPVNVGNLSSGYESNIPCTPLGCYLLLKKAEKNLNGKHAVVIGRSNLNGKGDWVKKGAIVIDVGINKTDKGIVGDVDFDQVSKIAKAITPVPGGVGPMTIACLLNNTIECFKKSNS